MQFPFILFVFLCIVSSFNNSQTFDQFHQWAIENNKYYIQPQFSGERMHRFEIFKDNLAIIQHLNEIQDSASFAMNEFGDLEQNEFLSMKAMPSVGNPQYNITSPLRALDNLPTAFNWNDHGAVGPIRNQGSAGSCWAFSTVENVAGQIYLKNNKQKPFVELSPEQLVDCDDTDCGVFGGWPSRAYQFIQKSGGLQAESTYPYCAGNGACYPCMANPNKTFCGPGPEYCKQKCQFNRSKVVAKVTGWKAIPADESTMQAELYSTGPLSVLINAGLLQFYHSGIVHDHPDLCDPSSLDHAVLLVGWGQEKTIFGSEEKYWIVKNSWGASWGESGYFRFEASFGTGKNIDVCGIDRAVTTALV